MRIGSELQIKRKLFLFLVIAFGGMLIHGTACAQQTGTSVDECSSGIIDSNTGVEQTVCLSGDSSGLNGYVEVDTFGGGNSWYWADAVGASGTISGPGVSTYIGDTCCSTYETQYVSIAPQINAWYYLTGSYDEDICSQDIGCGDWSYGSGGFAVAVEVTSPPAPSMSLAASNNPLAYGQLATFTATLSGGNSPTGMVNFQINGTTFGSATVSNGAAVYAGTNEVWAPGSYTITAAYSGDANNSPSSATITEVVQQSSAYTTVSAGTVDIRFVDDSWSAGYGSGIGGGDRNLILDGVSTTSTSLPNNSPLLTYENSGCNGPSGMGCSGDTLVSNSAVAGASSITVYAHGTTDYNVYPEMQVIANGSIIGDWVVNGSSQGYTANISPTLLSDYIQGQPVQLTASMVGQWGGTPTGSVTFYDGQTALGTASAQNGVANLTVSSLAAGTHSITAQYGGDGNFGGSSSNSFSVTIGTAQSFTESVGCSPSSVKFGSQITCTANAPAGDGTVTFYSPTTLTGEWWNGNSSSWFPPSGGLLATPPLAITHDAFLNYNLSGYPWAGAIGGPAGLNSTNFYVRWTGTFVSTVAGTYTIGVNSDDGANVFVDGTQLVNNLAAGQGAAADMTYSQSGTIQLAAGATNTIVVEYQQNLGGAGIQLLWTPPGANSPSLLGSTVVPVGPSWNASTTGNVLVAGNSTISAVYSGDSNYPATSGSTTINAVASTVTQISSNLTGKNAMLSALVSTGGGTPTGNVAFLDGGAQLGSAGVTPVLATNLVPNSQQFGSSNWGGYCGPTSNMSPGTTDIAAPDGSYTATKFVSPGSFACGQTPSFGVQTTIPNGLQQGQTYTVSVWLRGALGGETVIIGLNDCAAAIQVVTNTWQRYSVSFPSISSGIASCGTGSRGFQVLNNSSPNETFYVWGAQTELAPSAGPYIQTDASPRAGYGGTATFTTNALSPGNHAMTAHYSGDAQTTASTSSEQTVTVEASTWDTGTVTLTVNGVTAATTTYGEGSTIASVTAGLAAGLTANSPVTLSVVNGQLQMAAKTTGPNTDYSYCLQATSWDSTDFSQPSFLNTPVCGTFAGGADASVGPGTVYSFSIPSYVANQNPLGYDAVGNLVGYIDSVNGTWGFSYDSLNRLIGAAGQSPNQSQQNYCWHYDAFGNRTLNVNVPCSQNTAPDETYDSNNHLTGGSLVYDPSGNGNVITDVMGGKQYLYDAEGRICATQFTNAGVTVMTGYLYNAEGQRVSKGSITSWNCDPSVNGLMNASNATDYVLGPDGEQLTELAQGPNSTMQWQRSYVYAVGALIATYVPSSGTPNEPEVWFRLTDWLGSLRAITDVSGMALSSATSLPYGDGPTFEGTLVDSHYFTGKERDTESGLDYFGARYYGSSMGRFLSPDPSGLAFANPANPQSFNLYSYALNNPLINIDPNGLECVWDDGSYDSDHDPETGSKEQCENSKNGGTWIDHSYFTNNGMADWSAQPNDILAGMTVVSATSNASNLVQQLEAIEQQRYYNMLAGQQPAQLSSQGQQLLSEFAKDTAGVPTICSVTVTGSVGLGGGKSVGGTYNTKTGAAKLRASQRIGGMGPVTVSFRGTGTAGRRSDGTASGAVTIRDPESGVGGTVAVDEHGHVSAGVNVNRGIFNAGVSANLGTMGDPRCQ